ncbi:MAG: sensor histidine kinase [bacterium]
MSLPLTSIIIIAVLFLSRDHYAQTGDLAFERISTEQGLSQSSVHAILQDHQGFLWIGTEDGLNKYDGYNFTVYRHDASDSTSISDNLVNTVFEDRAHRLWIGTKNGLNLFDRATEKFTRFQHDPNDPHSISSNDVRSILADSAGALYLLAYGGGLYRLRAEDRRHSPTKASTSRPAQFTCFKHAADNPRSLSSNFVTVMLRDRAGFLWIGTLGGGLNHFDPVAATFTCYRHDPAQPRTLSSDNVVALCEDDAGDLWIGTYGGGLCRLRQGGRTPPEFISYPPASRHSGGMHHNTVLAVLASRRDPGDIWVGTFGGGLFRLRREDRESGKFSIYKHEPQNPASLSHDRIYTLCEDRTGNLWAGSMVGLNKAVPQPQKFTRLQHDPANPNSLSHPSVYAIWEARNGDLWVGTDARLDRIEARTQHVEHFPYDPREGNALEQNFIRAVCEDRAGTLWVGTFARGLSRWEARGRQKAFSRRYVHDPANAASLAGNFVTALCLDRTGQLWVGTTNGISRFEARSDSFRNYRRNKNEVNSLSDSNILALYEDRQGTIWVATYKGGVNRFDPRSGNFFVFKHDPQNANSLSHNGVLSIHQDGEGLLWFGTVSGLNRFDPHTQSFTRYGEKDGLANAFIYGILGDDEGNLWLSTNQGLSKFNDKLPPGKKFRNYDVKDGLQSLEFNVGAYHRGHSGALYFGGINGLNRFFPHEIRDNPHPPPIALTAFKVFNEKVALDTALGEIKTIQLSYRQNFFSFDFAALDLTQPEKNQYAYKMEGFDQDWIHSETRRYANYTNLDAGKYTFRVKGANNDEVWNEQGASVNIIITPPFWETWWFRLLAAAGVTGLLTSIYRYRVARLLEMERLRVRIASDLHDDIGSTLTKISLHSELIQYSAEPGEVKESLRKIGAMSRELITTMSDIVWSIDARNDTVGDLLDRMREFAASVLPARSIAFSFDAASLELPRKLPVTIRQNIYLIFKEAINNIAKHAVASRVEIRLRSANGTFNMIICDDGYAIPADESPTGQGLRNMQMRAQRIGGHLEISRDPGYTVSLTAPALR